MGILAKKQSYVACQKDLGLRWTERNNRGESTAVTLAQEGGDETIDVSSGDDWQIETSTQCPAHSKSKRNNLRVNCLIMMLTSQRTEVTIATQMAKRTITTHWNRPNDCC